MAITSRRSITSTEGRWTTTYGDTERLASGVAKVTAVEAGVEEAGRLRALASCAQMKQCVALKSSISVTRHRSK
jgi:hypothetical protein